MVYWNADTSSPLAWEIDHWFPHSRMSKIEVAFIDLRDVLSEVFVSGSIQLYLSGIVVQVAVSVVLVPIVLD